MSIDLIQRLVDFCLVDDSEMTEEEVAAELVCMGIDIEPSWQKIKSALDKARKQNEEVQASDN